MFIMLNRKMNDMEKECTVLLNKFEIDLLIATLDTVVRANEAMIKDKEDGERIFKVMVVNAAQVCLKDKLENILIINE